MPKRSWRRQSDPVQVKNDYFDQAKRDPGFAALLQIIRADPSNPAAAADKVMNNADAEDQISSDAASSSPGISAPGTPRWCCSSRRRIRPFRRVKVISPAAYTQGWTWRVAQAHPMGYSELRFGYWSDDPLGYRSSTTLPDQAAIPSRKLGSVRWCGTNSNVATKSSTS